MLFLLLPLAILTGMTLSPWFDANFPWLLTLFGGRQSARSAMAAQMASISAMGKPHGAASDQ